MNTKETTGLYYAMEEAYVNCKWGDVSRHAFTVMMNRLKAVYGEQIVTAHFKHIQSVQRHGGASRLERVSK